MPSFTPRYPPAGGQQGSTHILPAFQHHPAAATAALLSWGLGRLHCLGLEVDALDQSKIMSTLQLPLLPGAAHLHARAAAPMCTHVNVDTMMVLKACTPPITVAWRVADSQHSPAFCQNMFAFVTAGCLHHCLQVLQLAPSKAYIGVHICTQLGASPPHACGAIWLLPDNMLAIPCQLKPPRSACCANYHGGCWTTFLA